MNKFKIMLAGAIIDFYINKDKYEKYKTKRGKFTYVEKELKNILKEQVGKRIGKNNEIEIRDMDITSNNF